MKILAIRGKNLMSLPAFDVDLSVPPLSSCHLFAVTGPTGAGKSTLLDAMCLALFDRVPRFRGAQDAGELVDQLSAQDPRRLMRRHAPDAEATVEFMGVRKLRLRAHWSVRRARGRSDGRLQAQRIELFEVESGRSVTGKTKAETLKTIEGELGLRYEEFCRSVLLAQGDFSAFLRARGHERATLLERMTGTDIYARLSRTVFEKTRTLEHEQAGLRTALETLSASSRDARRALHTDIAEYTAKRKALAQKQAALARALEWWRTEEALQQEIKQAKAALEEAMKAAPALAQLESELAQQGRAEQLRTDAAQLDGLRQREAKTRAWIAEKAQEQARRRRMQRTTQRAIVEREQEAVRADAAYTSARPTLLAMQALDQRRAQTEKALAETQRAAGAADAMKEEATARGAALEAERAAHQNRIDVHGAWTRRADAFRQWQFDGAAPPEVASEDGPRWAALLAADQAQETAQEALDGAVAEASAAPPLDALQMPTARDPISTAGAALRAAWERRLACSETETDVARLELAKEHFAALRPIEAALPRAPAPRPTAPPRAAAHRDAPHAGQQTTLALPEASPAPAPARPGRAPYGRADATLRTATPQQHVARAQERLENTWHRAKERIQRQWLEDAAAADPALLRAARALPAHLRGTSENKRQNALTQLRAALAAAKQQADEDVRTCEANLRAAPSGLESGLDSGLEAARQEAIAWRTNALQEATARRDDLAQSFVRNLRDLGLTVQSSATADIHRALAQFDTRHRAATKEQAETKKALDLAEKASQKTAQDISHAAGQMARLTQERQEHEASLLALQAERQALGTEPDPGAALARLEKQRADAQAALEKTRRAHEAGAQALRAGRATLASHAQDLRQTRHAAIALQHTLAAAQAARGLDDAALARCLARPATWLAEKQEEADRGRTERARAEAQLADRTARSRAHQSARPGKATAAALTRDAETAEAEMTTLMAALADAKWQLAEMITTARHRARLGRAHRRTSQMLDAWRLLNETIGSADGKKFRSYAQSITLDALVALANDHLRHLRPRYSLVRPASAHMDLEVIDHDMGAERRGIASLSGGETFLLSLALSLALSDMSSERVAVESLFIDEGFGSLDPNALEVVLATLEALQATGRTIGLVSHVPELNERVGCQVAVRPTGPNTSQVSIEG